MDGIDASIVDVALVGGRLRLQVLASGTHAYSADLRRRVLELAGGTAATPAAVAALSQRVGRAFAAAARSVMRSAGCDSASIDAVASHGQTVCHEPGRPTLTVQLGEPAVIAEATGVTTVADFRVADTAAGGEGAPLVPYVHSLLFTHPRRERAVQNVGGMGNVTLLPAGAAGRGIRGSDTGPGNVLIDACVEQLSGGRRRYDRDGRLAARGLVDQRLVAEVLASPFFRRRLPASTGREEFGVPMARRLIRMGRRWRLDDASIVASVTMATASSVARSIARLGGHPRELFVCGGGAYNPTLLAMLAAQLPGVSVRTTAEAGVDPGALEATAFAVLGYCTLAGLAGNVPEATGARGPRVLGKVVPGRNYRGTLLGPAAAGSPTGRRSVQATLRSRRGTSRPRTSMESSPKL